VTRRVSIAAKATIIIPKDSSIATIEEEGGFPVAIVILGSNSLNDEKDRS